MALGLGALALTSHSIAGSIVAACIWTLGYGCVPTFFMSAAIRTHAVTADLAGAVINSASNVGIALGSLAGAQVLAFSGTAALPWVAACVVAVGFVVVIVSRVAFPTRPPAARDSYLDAITESLPVITAPIHIVRPTAS